METIEKKRKTDRRTIYSRNVIKEALLECLEQDSFERITVAAVCKQAEITRATFYLHYDNLNQVLDLLLEDALSADQSPVLRESGACASLSGSERNQSLNRVLIPVCQRAAINEKYRVLFRDASLNVYIQKKMYEYEKDSVIPVFMEQYHLSEWEAGLLFRFILNGSFAVNRELGWTNSPEWVSFQKLIARILSDGFCGLENG